MAAIKPADSVFINCPFDPDYWPLFEVIVFTVIACGFVPRSAMEESDGGEMRLAKIARLIAGSRFGIHDLSRVEMDDNELPRFNMPFELGIDWALKQFGTAQQRRKRMLILENKPHTLKKCLSDVGGQDPVAHRNSTEPLVHAVRHFLSNASRRLDIPGDVAIREQFQLFSVRLPTLCAKAGLDRRNLPFVEYMQLVRTWLSEQSQR